MYSKTRIFYLIVFSLQQFLRSFNGGTGGRFGEVNPSGIKFYNKIIDNLLLKGKKIQKLGQENFLSWQWYNLIKQNAWKQELNHLWQYTILISHKNWRIDMGLGSVLWCSNFSSSHSHSSTSILAKIEIFFYWGLTNFGFHVYRRFLFCYAKLKVYS